MQQTIHYHGGHVCPPHDGFCNNPPLITNANEFDCQLVPGSNPALYQCSHLN
jgi:hypothetical protein